MTENTLNKKRTALHIIIAEILGVILSSLHSAVTGIVVSNLPSESANRYIELTYNISNCALLVLVLAAYLLTGYLFTRNKRKAVVFASTLYFGEATVEIVTKLFNRVFDLISTTDAYTYLPDRITFYTTISIISMPFVILISYFFYTALEGNNKKIRGSLITSDMTLGRARKRYIAYSIIGGIVLGLILNIPGAVLLLINAESNVAYSAIFGLTEWLADTLTLAVVYFAGYKAYKNHIDGIAFGACSGLIGRFSSFFTYLYSTFISALSTQLPEIQQNPTADAIYYRLRAIVDVDSTAAAVSLVISLILAIFIFKYFFSEAKISLFSEDTVSATEAVEKDNDTCTE